LFYALYTALLALSLVLTLPYWLLQMMRHGKYRAGLRQRLGVIPDAVRRDSGKPTIWLHAVSVGEVVASSTVVDELLRQFPEHRVVVSTTTSTGQKLAARKFGEENVFYFPLDFGFAIRPYLEALRPDLCIIAETEFWPNFLRLTKKSGGRIAVINCRISDRSYRGYKRILRWLPRVLANADLFLAQTEDDKSRLIDIGAIADRIHVAGNLKFDVAPPHPPAIVDSLRAAFGEPGRSNESAWPVLVCGSTLDDEEAPLLAAFQNILATYPRATMVLAPRHPERFTEVGGLVEKLNIRLLRRSLWSGEPLAGCVLLLDSIGELAAVYSLATVAFVGGSLVPRGGHNILEPALFGVPIVTGNHYENFREIVIFFLNRNAVRVAGLSELPLVFMELIGNQEERAAIGRNALEALASQRGATAKTIAALAGLMGKEVGTRTQPVGDQR
jgi:3-deoxy-D-manno-octulosonic-acid transferase